MTNPTLNLIESLSEIAAPPGAEASIGKFIQSQLPQCHWRADGFGNLYCRTDSPDPARVLVSAHMDEVGLLVQAITPDGFLALTRLGGWSAVTVADQRWRIITRSGAEVLGVTAYLPPHHSKANKAIEQVEDLYIDVGASSAAEATELGIAVGDSVVPDSAFTALANDKLFVGKAFDNRLGVALAIELLQNHQGDAALQAFFSTQEEVGARGARAYSGELDFKLAIILEASPADDHPSVAPNQRQCCLQAGPQIRCYDPGYISNRALVDQAVELANELGIKHQLAVRRSGGTDASALQYKLRAPMLVIAVPTRYIHAHNSIFHLEDYLATRLLVSELIKRI